MCNVFQLWDSMNSAAGFPSVVAGAFSNAAVFAPLLAAVLAYFRYDQIDPEARLEDVDVEPFQLYPYYDFVIIGGGSAGE